MAHQLYVLQVLTFNLLEDRMMTKMDPQDQVSTHWTAGKAHEARKPGIHRLGYRCSMVISQLASFNI